MRELPTCGRVESAIIICRVDCYEDEGKGRRWTSECSRGKRDMRRLLIDSSQLSDSFHPTWNKEKINEESKEKERLGNGVNKFPLPLDSPQKLHGGRSFKPPYLCYCVASS